MTETQEQRIAILERQLAILEASHRELGEQTTHLIRLLSETRRELRESWDRKNATPPKAGADLIQAAGDHAMGRSRPASTPARRAGRKAMNSTGRATG